MKIKKRVKDCRKLSNREVEQLNTEIEAMSKFNDTLNAKMKELAHKVAKQREINHMLVEENARLINELKIAKKKEEDIKYEYVIEEEVGNVWVSFDGGFLSIERVKDRMQVLREIFSKDSLRIVRCQAEWEVVE